MRLAIHVADRVEDRELDDRDQGEVREVEDELLDPLPSADQERDARADEQRQHVVEWRQEEEADDGGEFAQREGVGLAPEVDLDDLEFGGREGHRQQRPRQRQMHRGRRQAGQLIPVDQERQSGEDGGEGPDPRRGRPRLTPGEGASDRTGSTGQPV